MRRSDMSYCVSQYAQGCHPSLFICAWSRQMCMVSSKRKQVPAAQSKQAASTGADLLGVSNRVALSYACDCIWQTKP